MSEGVTMPPLTASDRRDVEEALTLTRASRDLHAGALARLIRDGEADAYIEKLRWQVEACNRHIRILEGELAA